MSESVAGVLMEHLFREPGPDDVIRCICGHETLPSEGLQDWSSYCDHVAAAVLAAQGRLENHTD